MTKAELETVVAELEELEARVEALEKKVLYVAPPPAKPEPLPVRVDVVCLGMREKNDIGKTVHKSFLLEGGEVVRFNPSNTTQEEIKGKQLVGGGYENPVDVDPDLLRKLFAQRCTLVVVERVGDGPPMKQTIKTEDELEAVIGRTLTSA